MEKKHVKGPWVYNKEDQRVHLPNDYSKMIADVRGWGWIQKLPDAENIQDANGRLIASAPELLEALENLLNAIDPDFAPLYGFGDQYQAAKRTIEKVKTGNTTT